MSENYEDFYYKKYGYYPAAIGGKEYFNWLEQQLTASQAKSEKLAGRVAMLRDVEKRMKVEKCWDNVPHALHALLDELFDSLSATESDVEAYLAERDARAKNEGYVEAMEAASSKCYDLGHWDAGGHFKGYSGSDVDTEVSNAVYSLEIEFDRMAAERKKK